MRQIPRSMFIPVFSGRTALFLVLLLIALRTLAPDIWARNLEAGLYANIVMFIVVVFINCPAEWFFHRYSLHAIPFKWARSFAQKHRAHHAATSVQLDKSRDPAVVTSDYAIEDNTQYAHAQFPWWALPAFWLLFACGLVPLQLAAPHVPILLPGILGVTWTVWFYEVKHFIEHLPFRTWQRSFTWPFVGKSLEREYAFHLTHHANVKCNEGIAAFFGWYLADRWFGTYYVPPKLLANGVIASPFDFKVPEPRKFVQWLDRVVADRERKLTRS